MNKIHTSQRKLFKSKNFTVLIQLVVGEMGSWRSKHWRKILSSCFKDVRLSVLLKLGWIKRSVRQMRIPNDPSHSELCLQFISRTCAVFSQYGIGGKILVVETIDKWNKRRKAGCPKSPGWKENPYKILLKLCTYKRFPSFNRETSRDFWAITYVQYDRRSRTQVDLICVSYYPILSLVRFH